MRAIAIVRPGGRYDALSVAASAHVRVETDDDPSAALAGLAVPAVALSLRDGGRDIARLGARLAVHEAETGLGDGQIRILALVETARCLAGLGTLVGASARLCGLAWDAEALCRDLGAAAPRGDDGDLIPPLAQARATIRLAAAAAGIAAVDSAYPANGDPAGFLREVAAARRDGFAAKIAADPAQAGIILAA